jgi:hypothetical protein
MDHDCLHSPGWTGNIPAPARAIDSLRKDEGWICGTDPILRSEFTCLKTIYRISPATEAAGREHFRAHVKSAWQAARTALENDPAVRKQFDPGYFKTLTLRDAVIRSYFESRGSESSLQQWKTRSTALLRGSLYSAKDIPGFFQAIAHYEWLLERYSFVFCEGASVPIPDTAI